MGCDSEADRRYRCLGCVGCDRLLGDEGMSDRCLGMWECDRCFRGLVMCDRFWECSGRAIAFTECFQLI
ncbi:hypothetical protein [Anabaena azotica]|uniref:hypothetical protein n=1 Tax=Anabaena azotica TaxID=197653 RepID=UPI0039A69C00